MRFSCWLVAWCVLVASSCVQAQTPKEEPRVGWSLVLEGRTFRSAKDVGFYFRDPKAGSGKDPVRVVELELRQGDVRVARWPYLYELMLPKEVKDVRKGKRLGYARGLPEELLRWMGELAAGEYELGFLVNGVRATNVAAFRIDPAFEEAKAPVFEVGLLERPPLGQFSCPLLWVIGPASADRRITTLEVAAAPWRVDGVERKRASFGWAGAVSIVAWGERYQVIMDAKNYDPPVDERVAHNYEFEFAGHQSNTLRLDPQAASLGEAWDVALVRPGPEWPVSVRGVVTDAMGKPAVSYQVRLKTPVHMVAEAETDAQGTYALPGNLRHGMYELTVAKGKGSEPRFREVVAWQGTTEVRDFDFRNPATKEKKPPSVSKGKLGFFDLNKVEARLGKGFNVNVRDENGNTALAMALTQRRFDLARKLVETGAEVNTTRGDHTSMLALAIVVGDRAMVEFLLAKGADVNRMQGYDDMTPLMVAARKGSVELTNVLLDQGAEVKGRSLNGMGVMEWAVRGGVPEVIALLARKGADLNAMNDDGLTPLMVAAFQGKAASVEALIAAGAGVNAMNQDGWTALSAASFCQSQDGDYVGVARALLAAGARMNTRTELGHTPVSLTAKAGRADLLRLFGEAGAKLGWREGHQIMQEAIRDRKYAVMKELPKLGMDVNAVIYRGYTPLMYAVVMTNDPKAVHELVASGADVNAAMIEAYDEVTPLLAAARRKNADVVRELLAAGAKVDVRDRKGRTPLDLAREEKGEEVMKVLREMEARN